MYKAYKPQQLRYVESLFLSVHTVGVNHLKYNISVYY